LIESNKEQLLVDIVLDNGEVILATGLHPFYMNGEWIEAKRLKVDDEIKVVDGIVRVKSIAHRNDTMAVYNITVSDTHAFFVTDSDVLVHNQNKKCSYPGLLGIGRGISRQKQNRHVYGTKEWETSKGGYLRSHDDAQKILDDFHNGSAIVLGKTKQGHILVKHPGVVGYNNNPASGYTNQTTNVFLIKGSSSPSVVPTSPSKELDF
jgi:hypothetical protein